MNWRKIGVAAVGIGALVGISQASLSEPYALKIGTSRYTMHSLSDYVLWEVPELQNKVPLCRITYSDTNRDGVTLEKAVLLCATRIFAGGSLRKEFHKERFERAEEAYRALRSGEKMNEE